MDRVPAAWLRHAWAGAHLNLEKGFGERDAARKLEGSAVSLPGGLPDDGSIYERFFIESEATMPDLLRIIALDCCVDDVRRLRRCLQQLGDRRASLQHVADTRDAVVRLRQMRADVLLIDEDLPRLTGVETIRALRATGEPRPIIATTAKDCGYLAADVMRAGADGYLAKPGLHPALVGSVLDRALRSARSRQAGERLRRSAVRHVLAEHGTAVIGM